MGSAKRSALLWPGLALLSLLAACDERPAAPAPPAAPAQQASAPATAAPMPAEACADRWLAERKLNAFGDPPETNYPGGTPLFDERTGQRKGRLDHLFERHAELKAACAPK